MEKDFLDCEIVPAAMYKQFEAWFNCRMRNGFYLEKEASTGFFVIRESTNPRFQNGNIIQSIEGQLISKKNQGQVDKLCMTGDFSEVVCEELADILAKQKAPGRKRIQDTLRRHEIEQHTKRQRQQRDAMKILQTCSLSSLSSSSSSSSSSL